MPRQSSIFRTHEERMRFVIDLARKNARRGGGPFGAALFDLKTGRLLGAGVNRVLKANDPTAHAEINAIRTACRQAASHTLFLKGCRTALYTSAEPCGMCCTAILWAGVVSLVCGAATKDVERIGFDEGLKPRSWVNLMKRRGVTVKLGALRSEAVSVLREYRRKGGKIYNGR